MRAPALALSALLLALPVPPAPGQTLNLSLNEARVLARDAYRNGNYELAHQLAQGLLQARPDDTAALVIVAASAPLLGDAKAGREAGAKAWAEAEEPVLRHEAALYTARANMMDGRYTLSQFWLRRAYETADTPDKRAQIAQDFRKLRALSPWTTRLRFSVTPSSNVNGGSESDLLVIDDFEGVGVLSGDAQALSGTTTALQGEIGYKISRSSTHETVLGFSGYRTFNTLSDEARDKAPDAKGSDFDYGVAELSLDHRMKPPRLPLPDSYEAAAGHIWYGGEAYEKYVRLGTGRSFELPGEIRARLSFEGEKHWPTDGAQPRIGAEARLAFSRGLATGARVRLALGLGEVDSDRINSDRTEWEVELGYDHGKPVGPALFSAHLGYKERSYPSYFVGFWDIPGGRDDTVVSAGLDIRFHEMDYMGFNPVLSLEGQRSMSNISRFDSDTLSLSVGFESSF